MLRKGALFALAKAALEGQDHVARQALKGSDPAIAWWLRRRVAARIRDASACVADASDRAHVLRLAFLAEAGTSDDLALEDRDAVRTAFDEQRRGLATPSRFWFVSLAITLTTAAAIAGLLWWKRPAAPPFSPLASAAGEALGKDLTDFVSALYRKKGDGTGDPAG